MVHLLDISDMDTVCKTNFTQGPQTHSSKFHGKSVFIQCSNNLKTMNKFRNDFQA